MKKLATFLVAAGLVLPMSYGTANAAPVKAKAKSVRTVKAPVKRAPVNVAPSTDTTGMTPDRFHCEMGKSFTLYRNPNDKSYAILDYAGTRQRMYRVSSVTNAERYETNARLTFIGAANLTQLIDFKNSKPILIDCRDAKQQSVQNELDRQKAAQKKKTIRKTY